MHIRIGTRRSKLALAQTDIAINSIKKIAPECSFEIIEIVTSGDKFLDQNLAAIGGKGLFLKEIEEAMLSHKIDIAVHSMKDVPSELPEGLIIDCMLEREDPRDCFVSSRFNSLKEMIKGTVVGSSSARRAVLVQEMNPDVEVVPFRGNVITRLKKIETGEVDAAIFAIAGLKRLGLESVVKEIFDPRSFVPAVGQGAIGIERRTSDLEIAKLLSKISHQPTIDCVTKEREFMKLHSGNCTAPIGAYTDGNSNYFTMRLDKTGSIVRS